MIEYRCTRRNLYPLNSAGHTDLSARNGYFIRAESESVALDRMAQKFPNENGQFDIQVWRVVGTVQ